MKKLHLTLLVIVLVLLNNSTLIGQCSDMITPVYINGSRADNPNEPAVVTFDYNFRGTSNSNNFTAIATVGQVGVVWGTAYNQLNDKIYVSAVVKRHCDLSPDGAGAIYEIDNGNVFQVWDSLAIIETIADKFPEKQGWPKEAKARAVARTVSAEIHSSLFALRNALPMNLRKHFANYPITNDVQLDIDRVTLLWEYCRQHGNNKDFWLFGDFSGADAMFAPVVMRLLGYDVELKGFAAEYIEFVYNNKYMQEWINDSTKETQIIEEDEV